VRTARGPAPGSRRSWARGVPLARLATAALGLAVAALLLFGVLGLGRGGGLGPRLNDFMYIYAAGECWIDGSSPYDPATFSRAVAPLPGSRYTTPSGYPPIAAPLLMGLAGAGFETGRIAILALNLLAAALLSLLAVRLVEPPGDAERDGDDRSKLLLLAAVILGSPFVAHVVYMGQLSLLGAAALIGAWYSNDRQRPVLAGVLLGLACLKPQFALLPLLWLLLHRRFTLLVSAGFTCLLLGAWPMYVLGPFEAYHQWLDALGTYQAIPVNTLGFRHVAGLPSLLASAGVPMPRPTLLTGVGVACLFGLWRARHHFTSCEILAGMSVIQLGLVYGHDYDYVYLAPLAAALCGYLLSVPHSWRWVGAMTLALYIPQRLVRVADVPILNHWRTLVILAMATLLLQHAARRRKTEERVPRSTDTGLEQPSV